MTDKRTASGVAPFRAGNPFLNHVMQQVLRRNVPQTAPDPWTVDIYYEEVRLHDDDDVRQGPYIMPLVTLRTNPCRWSVNAGCVMCGYHLGARRAPVTEEHLIAQTRDAIHRLNPDVYHTLVFTSNGSFLDPHEVPDATRPKLLRMLRDAGFRFLVVETRPEYITQERLQEMRQAFEARDWGRKHAPISVSFGLESCSDFVQRYCINKGRRAQDYVRTFDLLKREGFGFDCYVLLGKPFMTAQEDVADALRTIRFAIANGAEYIFVMVTNMVDFGLTRYLESRGRYKLPSLWRVFDLMEQLTPDERALVQIKGISHAPVAPQFYARTCANCTEHVKGIINFWNQTGEYEHFRSAYPCSCRDEYRRCEWAAASDTPLPLRIHNEYHRLAEELRLDTRLLPDLREMHDQWEQDIALGLSVGGACQQGVARAARAGGPSP